MNVERENKIRETINTELSDDLDDIVIIDGLKFHYSEESDSHSKDLSATLSCYEEGNEISFERTGRKEISYERWVDTFWHDWT